MDHSEFGFLLFTSPDSGVYLGVWVSVGSVAMDFS